MSEFIRCSQSSYLAHKKEKMTKTRKSVKGWTFLNHLVNLLIHHLDQP
jgi:hypothetical protein